MKRFLYIFSGEVYGEGDGRFFFVEKLKALGWLPHVHINEGLKRMVEKRSSELSFIRYKRSI
jgi:hypothetical protein